MKVKKISLIIIILSALGYLIISRVGEGYYFMPMMYNYNYTEVSTSYNYYSSIALFVLIVSSVLLFTISFKFPRNNQALDILDKRLSSGDISIEEYKRLNKVLGGKR